MILVVTMCLITIRELLEAIGDGEQLS